MASTSASAFDISTARSRKSPVAPRRRPRAIGRARLSLRGIFQFLLDVFDGDEALQVEVLIDNEEFLDAGFCRMRSASSNVVPTGTGHEILFRPSRAHQL